MRFFRVDCLSFWGDYGRILVSGMSRHLPRNDSLIQLERCGPLIPPISFPGIGDVVVTEAFRTQLESRSLAGIAFQPVLKARIVDYGWHEWDRSTAEPAEYPEDGAPESYILARAHSRETADRLGSLWEVILPEDSETESTKIQRGVYEHRIRASTWQGSPFFRPKGKRHVIAAEPMKECLEENAGEWLAFQEMVVIE